MISKKLSPKTADRVYAEVIELMDKGYNIFTLTLNQISALIAAPLPTLVNYRNSLAGRLRIRYKLNPFFSRARVGKYEVTKITNITRPPELVELEVRLNKECATARMARWQPILDLESTLAAEGQHVMLLENRQLRAHFPEQNPVILFAHIHEAVRAGQLMPRKKAYVDNLTHRIGKLVEEERQKPENGRADIFKLSYKKLAARLGIPLTTLLQCTDTLSLALREKYGRGPEFVNKNYSETIKCEYARLVKLCPGLLPNPSEIAGNLNIPHTTVTAACNRLRLNVDRTRTHHAATLTLWRTLINQNSEAFVSDDVLKKISPETPLIYVRRAIFELHARGYIKEDAHILYNNLIYHYILRGLKPRNAAIRAGITNANREGVLSLLREQAGNYRSQGIGTFRQQQLYEMLSSVDLPQ